MNRRTIIPLLSAFLIVIFVTTIGIPSFSYRWYVALITLALITSLPRDE